MSERKDKNTEQDQARERRNEPADMTSDDRGLHVADPNAETPAEQPRAGETAPR